MQKCQKVGHKKKLDNLCSGNRASCSYGHMPGSFFDFFSTFLKFYTTIVGVKNTFGTLCTRKTSKTFAKKRKNEFMHQDLLY